MLFFIRYVNKDPEHQLILCEDFLKFVSVENTTGKNLANVILETINSFGINPKYMVGQGYDETAVISTLEELQLTYDIETSSNALQLRKTIITSDFLISVITASILFSQTLALCKDLQFVNCDSIEAMEYIDTALCKIHDMRSNMDITFSNIFEKAKVLIKSIDDEEDKKKYLELLDIKLKFHLKNITVLL